MQEVCACLRSEPPGDLAHRRQQRQSPIRRLHRLIGDGCRPRGQDRLGLPPVGCKVEVGEHRQSRVHQRVLWFDRLLDLEQQLALLPHLLGIRNNLRPDHRVRVVGKARPDTSSGLD